MGAPVGGSGDGDVVGRRWHFNDWEYPGGVLVRYSTPAHNSFGPNGNPGNKLFGSYGVMLQGSKGALFIDRAGYEITPQLTQQRRIVHRRARGVRRPLPNVRNFLDCVKCRQRPAGDIEIGRRSTAPCLISNIALLTGMKLKWDREGGAAHEQRPGECDADAAVSRAMAPGGHGRVTGATLWYLA